ncbi:uncharacterized protein At1g65710 [Abrus precatorius]|uniref:Uncharacterized protein At1g65710 n=1 Tax=Abrus precatorius TaxID=3816 RepID=A0A8B8MLI9_ABRPR|nr:uncharacterized protein At1g65710 [Abrus precatorius]
MGTCLSKKKGSSTSSYAGAKSVSTAPSQQQRSSENSVTVTLSKPSEPELNPKKKKTVEEKQDPKEAKVDESQGKTEIFIIKHRKSHDDRERASKISPCIAPSAEQGDANEEAIMGNRIAPSTPNMGVGVRTSSCTKEEVDAILIQCGRLSRSSSGKAATPSGRKYSGSKRSFDFDHCDNDAISAEDDQRKANGNDNNSEENDGVVVASENRHHRPRHRQSPRRSSPSQGRRRTPSREREQQCSSRERRVSRSPGRRSSETNANASASNNNTSSTRPGKMVSVPATVSSLVMDKSNNGGGESGKRIIVKRNVGDGGNGVVGGSRSAASPRAQSPARANGNVANAKVLGENQQQQQPSLSRNNSSRKAEQSPYRRNPLNEVDSNTNNGSSKVQNKSKIEAEGNQKPNGRVALEKGVSVDSKPKGQHEEEIKVLSSVPSTGVDNLKPQGLTRSRSSRRSRDLDINSEALVNPPPSYTSLLLEDIQNFHQKNPSQPQQPSISLPACLSKACSILEAVADLNSTTSSNFSGAFSEDKRSPSTQQSNEYNVQLGSNAHHYGKKVPNTKDPFIESEVVVSDDVMEPSLHKYVTVKRGGSVGGVDMEDQESSGSNSFTVSSSCQHHWSISSSSWEPNSADSTDCWTSRLDLGLESGTSLSSEAKKRSLNNKKRECDHEHSSGIGRGRLGSNKGLRTLPAATA